MGMEKEGYRKSLKEEKLSHRAVKGLLDFMQKHLKQLDDFPEELLKKGKWGEKITDNLGRLELRISKGNKSWEGLVVGFPGTKKQLSTEFVGTPYIREILYPILDLHRRLQQYNRRKMPCIYLLGERFNDVFLRKFRLLNTVTPHVVVLTDDLLHCIKSNSFKVPAPQKKLNEAWIQYNLCKKMLSNNGLSLCGITTKLLAFEVPTHEGTKNPERLDILGYDANDGTLIALELKGPDCGRVQLENLFLQGMEHRNWLEENKMAVKFMFEGPRGDKINTRKRVRLMLGFCDKTAPNIFYELREIACKKDKHLNIDFCRFNISKQKEVYIEMMNKY